MTADERIRAIINTGHFFSQFTPQGIHKTDNPLNTVFFDRFQDEINNAHNYNQWFTAENVRHAIYALSLMLDEQEVLNWINSYPAVFNPRSPKKIGVIMAGNIPMAGFHDFLCVLVSGNYFIGKLSSKDQQLMKLTGELFIFLNPGFKEFIHWETGQLSQFDAVIASGGNLASRYFNYYFAKYPSIIRRNRNSVAILDGFENQNDMDKLADDIFLYFGLGCRNVSKLFVPTGYNFDLFFKGIEKYKYISDHNKYCNNYEYQKSIYLLSITRHMDNGFILLKKDNAISSPVGVLYYDEYISRPDADTVIKAAGSDIQCVATRDGSYGIPFGSTQFPQVYSYADNIDVMEFLLNL